MMKPVVLILSVIITIVTAKSCVTPNGERATCVSLLKCAVLIQAVQDYSTHAFFESSMCPEGNFMVCCGTSANFTFAPKKPVVIDQNQGSRRDYALKQLIPSRRICGLQHTDDYFYNGTETSVDEFPWLVYFVLQENYVNNFYLRKESNCVGVLISDQYVLTLYDECLRNTWVRGGLNHTIEMLFGQHHIYKNVSCIPTKFGVDDCSLPVLREVSYTWQNRNYLTGNPAKRVTVAVVRILKKLSYSDYIRPICLPLRQEDFPVVGDTIASSGWGEPTYVNGKNIKLKKRVRYSLMDDEECEAGNALDKPVCGVPWENNTNVVCPGDNGGPLMYKTKKNWFVIGLLSVPDCDEVRPVTAERLTSSVVDWIINIVAELEEEYKNATHGRRP